MCRETGGYYEISLKDKGIRVHVKFIESVSSKPVAEEIASQHSCLPSFSP